MALLEVKNLHTYFKTKKGTVKAVNDVSYSLDPGRTIGIVGESGSGKSVSAMSILRLLDDNGYIASGSIRFDGKELTTLPLSDMYHIRGNAISVIFQEPMTSLNPVFSVERQLCEPFMIHQGMRKKEARRSALKMLYDVQIPNPETVMRQYPHQLSGGMLQRIMIGIAMALQPELLIADEPTTAIDAVTQYEILEEFVRIKKNKNTAMLFITHDLGAISKVADRILVMNSGHIVDSGDFEHIRNHANDPYTRLLIEKRSAVMCHYRDILHGKEISHA